MQCNCYNRHVGFPIKEALNDEENFHSFIMNRDHH
jgi:hypothetical protein